MSDARDQSISSEQAEEAAIEAPWWLGALGLVMMMLAMLSLLSGLDGYVADQVRDMSWEARRWAGWVTHAGHGTPWYVVFGVALLLGVVARHRRMVEQATLGIGAILIAGALVNLLKVLFGRFRPNHDLAGRFDPFSFEGSSFPSGHSSTAGAVAVVLALTFPRCWPLAVAFGVFGAGVRVFSNAHFVSDALLGLYIGVASAVLLHRAPSWRDTVWDRLSALHDATVGRLPVQQVREIVAILAVAIGVTLVTIGIVRWERELKHEVFPKRWGAVEPGSVYRSGQISAQIIKQVLVTHEIDMVIALGELRDHVDDERREARVIESLGIELVSAPLNGDGTGRAGSYVKAITAIERARAAGRRVLVHCSAGTHRTGGVLAMWRVLVQGMPIDAAKAEMRRYAFDPHDNRNLYRYLNGRRLDIARGLADAGVIREPQVDELPHF